MNRKSLFAAALMIALFSAGTALAEENAAEKAKIRGEVIDSACYIKMGAKGPDHAKCAVNCAKAGIPLALLTDEGHVVWLSSDKDMESVNPKLVEFASKKVVLTGTWHKKGGTKLFSVEKVELAS
jgi:hypothetical protein